MLCVHFSCWVRWTAGPQPLQAPTTTDEEGKTEGEGVEEGREQEGKEQLSPELQKVR
jgi:hypothetical protein